MKRMVILYTCLLAGVLFSCNPAIKATQQKKNIDALCNQCIADYVKANPCPQLPLIDLDSLCMKIGYSWNVVEEPGDSSNGDGVLLSLEKKDSCKPAKPKHILVPGPPDTRMMKLLQDTIAQLKWELSFCKGKETGIKEVYRQESKWKWNNWGWMFAAFVLLTCIVLILVLKRKR
jgi:hypothetical protein